MHWLDVSKRNYVETGYHCYTIDAFRWEAVEKSINGLYRYILIPTPEGYELILPIWFSAAAATFLAAAPWIRRYSLRTLLLATTLVVVVLGAIVYATR